MPTIVPETTEDLMPELPPPEAATPKRRARRTSPAAVDGAAVTGGEADRFGAIKNEMVGLGWGLLGIFLLGSLVSYDASDRPGEQMANWFGRAGHWVAENLLIDMVGWGSWLMGPAALYLAWRFFTEREIPWGKALAARTAAFGGLVICAAALSSVVFSHGPAGQVAGGGTIGLLVGQGLLARFFSRSGAVVIGLALTVVSLQLLVRFSLLKAIRDTWHWARAAMEKAREEKLVQDALEERESIVREMSAELDAARPTPEPVVVTHDEAGEAAPAQKKKRAKVRKVVQEAFEFARAEGTPAPLPPVELLQTDARRIRQNPDALQATARLIEKKLLDFGVKGGVTQIEPGPVATTYEFEPGQGVRVSAIQKLIPDLKLGLAVPNIRILAPIPGKSVVGIEVPNKDRETITLKELVEDDEFQKAPSPYIVPMGKNIHGKPIYFELTKAPHLLVAGTTGAGKSVWINSTLISLLYKCRPEDARFIMIDPKMVELKPYEDIPHLLAPIIVDVKKAASALRWAVAEMEHRLTQLAERGVRSIDGYNETVRKALKDGSWKNWHGSSLPAEAAAEGIRPGESAGVDAASGLPSPLPESMALTPPVPMHRIFVVVDEMADLMMTVGKEVEVQIQRIAQMARAVGIHLIIATQRPSVNIVTGSLKANLPTRVSFKLRTGVDSKTVLDEPGAEELLGNGDMLFIHSKSSAPERIHGAFISDDEVNAVCDFLRKTGKPEYIGEILTMPGDDEEGPGGSSEDMFGDPRYIEAIRVVLKERKISISYLQRRMSVGYNKAARYVEQMEYDGIVGPQVGQTGRRDLILPPEAVEGMIQRRAG
ncbi:MAG: DNA translocase FtsK 4TM domain-containing protein [Deltaproteobacteria bacterium]|nr:DNA translocase FtsK 4TM domain-containing protein [Deltaproteobacteria bacterium]